MPASECKPHTRCAEKCAPGDRGRTCARRRPPNTAGAVYIFARRNAASPILANGTVCDLNRPHSIGRLPYPAVGPACRAGRWAKVPPGRRDLRDESRPPTASQAEAPPGRRDLRDESRPPTARQAKVPPGRRDLRDESRPPTARQAKVPPGRRDLHDENRPPTARQAKVPPGRRDLRDESRPPTARQAEAPPGRRDLHDESRPPTARQAKVPPGRRDLRDQSRPPTARQAKVPPGRRDLHDESRPLFPAPYWFQDSRLYFSAARRAVRCCGQAACGSRGPKAPITAARIVWAGVPGSSETRCAGERRDRTASAAAS